MLNKSEGSQDGKYSSKTRVIVDASSNPSVSHVKIAVPKT